MRRLQRQVSFEQFKPHIRQGKIIPHGAKIIYELEEPFDQIVFPVELADLLLLCSGQFTIREIIEKMYKRQGFVHFKTIFKAVIQLKERDFLVNGDQLDVPDRSWGLGNSLLRSLSRCRLEIPLGQRVVNDRLHPILFYILSMSLIVGSILSFQYFPDEFTDLQFLRIGGSYVKGLGLFFLTTSILLSLKNIIKALMLLFLTGRIYNAGFIISPFAAFFRAGKESLFLVPNKLYLTIFHLSVSLCYFLFAGLYIRYANGSAYADQAMVIALILTLVDFDPFRKSELNQYLHTIKDNDSLSQISSYLKDKSLLSLVNPSHSEGASHAALPYVACIWSVTVAFLLIALATSNAPLVQFSIQSGDIVEAGAAIGLVALGGAIASIVTVNVGYTLFMAVFPPIKRRFYAIKRFLGSMRHIHWSSEKLQAQLEVLPLFTYFSERLLTRVIEQSRVLSFKKGSKIIIQGDLGQHIFILLQGSVAVEKEIRQNQSRRVGLIRPVSIFGEVAVIEDVTRTADVVALERSVVLQVPASVIRQAATESRYIREIEHFRQAIMVNQFFTSAPMFRDLPEEVAHHFTTRGKVDFYEPGDVVFEQGDLGNAFYLILRGSVNVVINDVFVKRLKQGGFFGEIGIIANIPRTATILCQGPTVLLKISSDAFWEVLVQHIEMAMFIESVGEMRLKEDVQLFEDSSPRLKTG